MVVVQVRSLVRGLFAVPVVIHRWLVGANSRSRADRREVANRPVDVNATASSSFGSLTSAPWDPRALILECEAVRSCHRGRPSEFEDDIVRLVRLARVESMADVTRANFN